MVCNRKNNELMALLSVWGILLVVLGHSGFEEPVIQQRLAYLHSWIYSFHMPLFFMISGFLYSLTNKDFYEIQLPQFLQKKVNRLLVPYIVLGVVLFIIKFSFASFSHADRVFSVSGFFAMFVNTAYPNSTMGYLWYVFSLFMIFVIVSLFPCVKINLKHSAVCCCLMLVFAVLHYTVPVTSWMNLSSVCRYMPFFLLGIVYEQYQGKIDSALSGGGGGIILLVITFILSVALTILDIPVCKCVYEPVRATLGLLMSVELCRLLLKSEWIRNNILPFSRYTYSIYLLSWFGQYAAKILFVNILHLHWSIVVLAMFVSGIMVPIGICQIVEKVDFLNNKWVRRIIGY